MTVLDVSNFTVRLPTEDGIVHAVENVSFRIEAGELFGVAGESGSGKSVLTQAIMGLLPHAEISGAAVFEGVDLLKAAPRAMRAIRGARIAMIFQDPLSSLNPYHTIGGQIAEVIHSHEKVERNVARERAIDILAKVGIPAAAERFDSYPHQFSGGMRQRVMIAMALVLKPALVIADEPTTALDVTVRAQILALIDRLRRETGTSIMMITHDLALLERIADRVMVMYAGHRMEYGDSAAIFAGAAHPYTRGLLASSPQRRRRGEDLLAIPGRPPSLLVARDACAFAPRCGEAMPICTRERPPLRHFSDGLQSLCWLDETPASRNAGPRTEAGPPRAKAIETVLSVENVHLEFTLGGFVRRRRHAVLNGVGFEIRRGETLGLVGESGCGKSTLARVIAGLIAPSKGSVTLLGRSVASLDRAQWTEMRRNVQLVFQDPFGSLNPRRRVGSIIGDPFRIHRISAGEARRTSVQHLMEIVGLNPEHYNRFPAEFSGGQRQRIGIARALALNPSLIILDEPVSALDVSIQAQILNLMQSLQRELGLTYLLISHDLAVVRHVCDRVAVMREGRIVELGATEDLFSAPRDAYTRALLAASHIAPSSKDRAPGAMRRLVETHGAARSLG